MLLGLWLKRVASLEMWHHEQSGTSLDLDSMITTILQMAARVEVAATVTTVHRHLKPQLERLLPKEVVGSKKMIFFAFLSKVQYDCRSIEMHALSRCLLTSS
jgi:hypothetical protein